MNDSSIGFIGLGNVGSKVANNIIGNGYKLYIHDLDEKTAESLWKLTRRLGKALQAHCDADKVNSAAIGNMVPQLHFHIVARHVGDAVWPHPIWGNGKTEPLANATKAARIESIQSWLGN